MTTLAFVAGMVSLVVSSGTGTTTNRTIGSVIIEGQTLALLLTLIGTTACSTTLVEWKPLAKVAGLFSWKNRRQEELAAV